MTIQKNNSQAGIAISFEDIANYLMQSAEGYIKASFESNQKGKQSESIIQLMAAGCLLNPLREVLDAFPPEEEDSREILKTALEYYDGASVQIKNALAEKRALVA